MPPRRLSVFFLLLFATITSSLALSGFADAAGRPNFVIMMTDDQRADAISCAGNRVLSTPNMDRIASEGVRFRNMFVTNSLCRPSRATLLTGMYSHSHGIIDNKGKKRLKPDQPILSDLLHNAGYEVAFCGKSHISGALRDRKWDYYFGYKGQGRYQNPVIAEGVDGKDVVYPGYMDDIVTTKAVKWLAADHDRPFCLFLFFKAPHRSWIRARRHHDLFRDAIIEKPSTYDEDLNGYPGKPRAFANADNKIGNFNDVRSLDGFVKDYYATLVAVDENVGRVLKVLKETERLDDTAVLFTSDNGFFHGEWRAFDKRFMHEPSIRVPLLLRYPKLIKAGALNDSMVLNIDIAPTVLELAGVSIPPFMQGQSLVPLLKGEKVSWRKDWLYEYFEYPGAHSVRMHRGVRTERYKYIHYPAYEDQPEEFELYDLQNDPEERNNLYGKSEYADLASRLKQRLVELRRQTGDL